MALLLTLVLAAYSGTCFGYVLVESQPYRGIGRDYLTFLAPIGVALVLWYVIVLVVS